MEKSKNVDQETATDGRDCATAGEYVGKVRYNVYAPGQRSMESDYADIEVIKPRSRDQYISLFRGTEKRTAQATLRMCRVVYEAKQTLDECDFRDFCVAIGYSDTSSAIRKFCAIGKLHPRLVQYADQLPHEWSKIYKITQIPARAFELIVNGDTDFRYLRGRDLQELVDTTTNHRKRLDMILAPENDSRKKPIAKVEFTKPMIDAYDWRAVQKAFAEIETRLPVRIKMDPKAEQMYEQLKDKRYNAAKQNARDAEFKPALWDYGEEANQRDWYEQDKLAHQQQDVHSIEHKRD